LHQLDICTLKERRYQQTVAIVFTYQWCDKHNTFLLWSRMVAPHLKIRGTFV